MPERFLEHCPACGGGESETIEHMLVECPRWGYHRHNFGLLVPEFRDFISSQVSASTPEDLTAFILGGVPPSLHGALDFTGNGKFFQLWRRALPHIAFFVAHVSHSRNALLRGLGLAPTRITRMGRRPNG